MINLANDTLKFIDGPFCSKPYSFLAALVISDDLSVLYIKINESKTSFVK